MLEELLSSLKNAAESASPVTDAAAYDGELMNIGTFNAISKVGLNKFASAPYYNVMPLDKGDAKDDPHCILLRSYKLKSEEVPVSVRAIARCGAGTNNVPVDEMTARGIPVFNTPGANANAVKELVVCSLLLASRGIIPGIQHVKQLWVDEGSNPDVVKKRVESDKKMFKGNELAGKTLGIIGLGNIGAKVAVAGVHLGMNVVGVDPAMSVDSAWSLPGHSIRRAKSVKDVLAQSDYISLHAPYIKGVTHHLMGPENLGAMKPGAHLLNFSRGELVDTAVLRQMLDAGTFTGKYFADFADEHVHDHENVIEIPHLGASTDEAEANSACMAADEIRAFVESGAITNSVNFPDTAIGEVKGGCRICIVNRNVPGVLGKITSQLGDFGVNILQQVNTSRDDIAYNIVDVAQDVAELERLQTTLAGIEGVLSSRLIASNFQVGYFVTKQ